MGGFITANAMARIPTLINRAILCAPMIRMKCGTKANDWQYPLPQDVAYWASNVARFFNLGSAHALGFFKELPDDVININVYTSSEEQQNKWIALRKKYPSQMITTCVTNDWVYHSIRAQRRLAERYQHIQTNTLILR
jgi:alpha-beta hydrolase superfamily lysophospholipase